MKGKNAPQGGEKKKRKAILMNLGIEKEESRCCI